MFSPAGQATLHGGSRSTYIGRSVRQVPVWLARLDPGSRVMAKGLRIEQAELADVAVGHLLDSRNRFVVLLWGKQVSESALWLQVLLHRQTLAYLGDARHLAVLGFVHREEARLFRKARDPDRAVGSVAPAERTRHEDVDVARAADF